MVIGDVPKSCSEMVWALVELIKPVSLIFEYAHWEWTYLFSVD